MKKVFPFAFVLTALIASGCAVMNTSVLETAETVKSGHAKIGVEGALGLDLTSVILIEEDLSRTLTTEKLLIHPIMGGNFGVGIHDRMEMRGNTWLSLGGVGCKLNLKYRLPLEIDKKAIAIAPGLTFVTTETKGEPVGHEIDIPEIQTIGGELPVIYSYRLNENFIFYGVARYSFDRIKITYPNYSKLSGTHPLHRVGIIVGLSLEAGPFIIRPEIGLEVLKRINGNFGAVPIFAGGLGFSL